MFRPRNQTHFSLCQTPLLVHSYATIESSQVNLNNHFKKYGFSSSDDVLIFKMEKYLFDLNSMEIVVANCLIIINFLAFLQRFGLLYLMILRDP